VGATGTAIVWDELANGERRVWIRSGDHATAEAFSTGGTVSYPAIAATARGFMLGWTEQDGERAIVRTRVFAARR